MEAIYKVTGYDYEKYYTAKGLKGQAFIKGADEFLTYCEKADFAESYATFADVMRDVEKGGKWDVECLYNDGYVVIALTIEKISIINS